MALIPLGLLVGLVGAIAPQRPLVYRPSSLAVLAISQAAPTPISTRLRIVAPESSGRGRRVLIGGVIGAVAGLAVCTAISNIAKDPGTGFSTCTWKGNLAFAAGGFAVGAGIGAVVR